MKKKRGGPVKVLGKHPNTVKIYERNDANAGKSNYAIRWYANTGKLCSRTRTDFKEAVELAKEVAVAIDGMQRPSAVVSKTDAQVANTARAMADKREIFAFLEDAGAAMKKLPVGVSLTDAAEYFVTQRLRVVKEAPVAEVFDAYAKHQRKRTTKRNADAVLYRVRPFMASFGKSMMNTVTREDCQVWLDAMAEAKVGRGKNRKPKYGERTLHNFRAAVISFFRWARGEGYLPPDTVTAPEETFPVELKSRAPTTWDAAQVEKLMHGVRDDLRSYAAVIFFAGLRPSEALRLDWGDVHLKGKESHIYVSPETAQKTRKDRYVYVRPNLLRWLMLERSKKGKLAPKTADYMLADEGRRLGLVPENEKWPQDVARHSYCSHLLALTDDFAFVASQAGHTERVLREVYRKPVTREEGAAYFNVAPKGGGEKVVPIKRKRA